MKLSAFKSVLDRHAEKNLAILLPGGDRVPAHFHVTEVGSTRKRFLDCGGKLRDLDFASLQIWVADDVEHRLPAGKLAAIVDKAADFFGADDLELQVECQQNSIALFSIEAFEAEGDTVVFRLANKQTACLAMEVCVPDAAEEESCCGGGSSCCG